MAMKNLSFVFCEGGSGSLDTQLLEQGIFPHLSSYPFAPKTVPTGGKAQMAAFIQGYFSQSLARQSNALDSYIGFRDRDFDYSVQNQAKLRYHAKRVVVLHRTCIENYLLTPQNFYRWAQSKGFSWCTSETSAHDLFEEAARKLYFYTLGRAVIGKIKSGRPLLNATWLGAGESLYDHLVFEKVLEELQQYFLTHATFWGKLTPSEVSNAFEAQMAAFPESKYLDRSQPHSNYLTQCSGKDLVIMLEQAIVAQSNIPKFSLGSNFWKFALNHFVYTEFPDWVELKEILDGTKPLPN